MEENLNQTIQSQSKLPHALPLEESVLGALLLERDALIDVIEILKPESFYSEQNNVIYQAILSLFNKNEAIDLRTVVNELRKNSHLNKAGGPSYVASLIDSIASASHIEDHAKIIAEKAMMRELFKLGKTVCKDSRDETVEVLSLLDRTEQSLFDISAANIRKNYTKMSSLLAQALKELEERKSNKDSIVGTPTGFIELDRFTLGWQKSDFVVVAARPAMGKTALLLTFLRNAAIDHNVPVAFFSLEMSSMQLTNRMIASESGIDGEKIKRGSLERHESERLYYKTAKLAQAPIYIDDTPSLSLFEFRLKSRRLKAQEPELKVIFVDYLQLMVDDSGNKNFGNREQQIAAISRGIKAIAKELDICIVVASQLSRSVETRGGDKRPQLSDLRESGAIEQDADMVIFPYRPEYYGITQDDDGNDTRKLAEIIIAKHRNGPTGKVNLKFIASITRFADFELENDIPEDKIFESKMNSFDEY